MMTFYESIIFVFQAKSPHPARPHPGPDKPQPNSNPEARKSKQIQWNKKMGVVPIFS